MIVSISNEVETASVEPSLSQPVPMVPLSPAAVARISTTQGQNEALGRDSSAAVRDDCDASPTKSTRPEWEEAPEPAHLDVLNDASNETSFVSPRREQDNTDRLPSPKPLQGTDVDDFFVSRDPDEEVEEAVDLVDKERGSENAGMSGVGLERKEEEELSLLYHYLKSCTIAKLRKVCKRYKIKQPTLHAGFVANILVWLKQKRSENKNIIELIKCVDNKSFERFERDYDICDDKYATKPNWEDILSSGDPFRKQRLQTSSGSDTSRLTLSEVARLVVLLRDEEDAKIEFITTGLERSRRAMDAPRRVSFWKTIVEERFNSTRYSPHLDVSEYVSDVDTRAPPVNHRSADVLLETMMDIKKFFSIYYDKWDRSGNHNPKNFRNYVFQDTTPKLVETGNRCLIVFSALRIGTPYVCSDLLTVFVRVLGGASPIGIEAGLPEHDRSKMDSRDRSRARKRRRVSRKSSESHSSSSAVGRSTLREQISSLVQAQTRKEEAKARVESSRAASLAESAAASSQTGHVNMVHLKQRQDIMSMLEGAQEMMKNHPAGSELFEVAKRQFTKLMKYFDCLSEEE